MRTTTPQASPRRPRALPSLAGLFVLATVVGGCAGSRVPAGGADARSCCLLVVPCAERGEEQYPVDPSATARCACAARRSCLEPYFGAGAGPSIPENQDLKFKRFDASGLLIDDLFSANVDASEGLFVSLQGGAWVTSGPLANWGFEVQGVDWTTRVAADSPAPKPGHPSTGALPPFDSVDERREALLGCIERRVSLFPSHVDGAYAFFGAGAGPVYTVVDHGPKDWAPGVEVFAGAAWPLSDRVRLRFDLRWITTHDADSKGTSEEWRVDTSGRPSWPRSPHLDTRFLVPLLSLEVSF